MRRPVGIAAALRRLVGEYEGRASREAECSRDADKLDMLLQALEYREAGWRNLDPFIQTAVTARRTPRGGGWGGRDGGLAGGLVAGLCPRCRRSVPEALTASERPWDGKGPLRSLIAASMRLCFQPPARRAWRATA